MTRPLGSGALKTLSYGPCHISLYLIASLSHLPEDDVRLLLCFVITLFFLVGFSGLSQRARLQSVWFLPLESFFSDVSILLTVIALDSPLIFLLPPLFQETGPWGERWLSSLRSFSIRIPIFVHPDVLFLWFSLRLPSLSPVCRGVHGVWVTGRLILWFEGVEELYC